LNVFTASIEDLFTNHHLKSNHFGSIFIHERSTKESESNTYTKIVALYEINMKKAGGNALNDSKDGPGKNRF